MCPKLCRLFGGNTLRALVAQPEPLAAGRFGGPERTICLLIPVFLCHACSHRPRLLLFKNSQQGAALPPGGVAEPVRQRVCHHLMHALRGFKCGDGCRGRDEHQGVRR